jgi:hypothetical protein
MRSPQHHFDMKKICERIDRLMDGPVGTVINAIAFAAIMFVAAIAG